MEIELTQNQTTIVPDSLFDQLNLVKWYATWMPNSQSFYAVRNIRLPNGKQRLQYMHNYIYELLRGPIPDGYSVDHADRDTLNNQTDNLRLATRSQQSANRRRRSNNTTGFIGVSRHGNRWRAQSHIDGKRIHLGLFDDPYHAAAVRDAFVKKHHGEFAVTNF